MTQREEWMNALHQHELEVERLRHALEALGATSREIEYNTAQMIRHEISMALISSRLAA